MFSVAGRFWNVRGGWLGWTGNMVLAGFTEPQAGVGREETRLDRVILCSRITGICYWRMYFAYHVCELPLDTGICNSPYPLKVILSDV